jgi:hypothetical protein
MLSLEEQLSASKERVASRKEIKILRTQAAAEQRAKNKPVGPSKLKEPKAPKAPKIYMKPPEQILRYNDDRRTDRAHSRIVNDENSYSLLNTSLDKASISTDQNSSTFEEKINRDAVKYEVSKNKFNIN